MRTALQLALLGCVLIVTASAQVVLTFDGLQDQEQVLNYYNGGFGSLGSGPGPDYGVTFGYDAFTSINGQNGGTGNFAGNPSGDSILVFLGINAIMNDPGGFTTGFSFYYSAISESGTINIYSGINDTGSLLQTITVPLTPSEVGSNPACADPVEPFCPFFPLGVTFSGIARSVDFSQTVNKIGFDNVTLGSSTAGGSPEPVTSSLLGLGLTCLVVIGRVRKKAQRSVR